MPIHTIHVHTRDLEPLVAAHPGNLIDGTNLIRFLTAYDDTTQEYGHASFCVPSSLDTAGTVTFRLAMTAATAAAGRNVQLRFDHAALADGEPGDAAGPYTAEDSGDLALDATQDDITIATWTETVAALGWSAGDWVAWRLSRVAAVANDLVGDLHLLSFSIEIPEAHTVDVPIALTSYLDHNTRFSEQQLHGAFQKLVDDDPLAAGVDITLTTGIGKLVIVVNQGVDTAGDIVVTGTSVDRNSGAESPADTDTIAVAGLTVDSSVTDAHGNVVHGLANAYITSKWFTGAITISTTEVDLTDVDVWLIAFEQFNDEPELEITTLDITTLPTNANAELAAHLYKVDVNTAAKTVVIGSIADLVVSTPEADTYHRLRRGNIGQALNGTSDGVWLDLYMGPINQTYWDDTTIKVWGTITVGVD